MRIRVGLLLLALVPFAPATSHAAPPQIIRAVDADNGDAYVPVYTPKSQLVAPGSTLTWRNDDLGSRLAHTVTPYFGSLTFSPQLLVPQQSFSAVYGGGTALFRCEYHSSLDTTISPPGCTGMCGAIHDSTPDISSPSVAITTPNGFIFTGGVRIDGTASDDRAIKTVALTFRPVAEVPPLLPAKSAVALCNGCDGPSVKWKSFTDPGVKGSAPFLTMPPGQYRVEAVATDPHGNAASAAPITITVLT